MRHRFLPILLLLMGLLGCGGGSLEDKEGSPIIYDFRPARASLNSGDSTLLVANFVGGTAQIDQKVGYVASGIPMSITPAQTTTYTLTVTAANGKTAIATSVVTVGDRNVEIVPESAHVLPGGTYAFDLNVAGLSDSTVTWTAEAGSVDASGFYTAPATPGVYKISATSKADPTLCAKAFVTVSPVAVGSDGSFFNTTIQSRLTFPVYVIGSSNLTLVYSVLEPNGGSITAGGVYTAPNEKGVYHVVVRAGADPNAYTLLTITVKPIIVVYPTSQQVAPGTSFPFKAAMMGVRDSSVIWSVSGSSGGTVDAHGVYTAGSTGGTTYVAATSVEDPTLSYQVRVDDVFPTSYSGSITPTAGAMATARAWHTMTRMPYDSVLVCGGLNGTTALASAELYSPYTDQFTPTTGAMTTARSRHTATLLANGQVLITGGRGSAGTPLASAEVYDINTNSFTPLASALTTARENHHAELLQDGRVLIVGGTGTGGATLNAAEVFDPLTRTFSALPAMSNARVDFGFAHLPDGRVFLAGGSTNGTDTSLSNSAQRFDAGTNGYLSTGNLVTAVRNAGVVALPSGDVGLFGGVTTSVPAVTFGAQIYGGASNAVTALTPVLSTPRNRPLCALLATGQALVMGGSTDAAGTALNGTFDIFDPGRGFFSTFGSNTPEPWIDGVNGRCLLLANGSVLLTGNTQTGAGAPITSALFQ